ncbi:pyridoxamine 5'-phosphate oxidase family protein [Nocardia brasiliensis]|uniref:Oxidoreductase FAD-binding domain-containing protein n=1 Tax=Nocardia brasiliensis (strain ATCC 700358 / HUJEG-1) TaxID=1133849 RepID=K0F2M0_NOCB7|nr:pyridoxamine 5'-phosphate oxidase family protein [Nocardia brasiliensis]AFU03714.1 Oxidoreductase FAD-binding domain-containing protein [Nocardia brasiliensis ATCC 700358]OCF89550.1 oxidoreductase [Nocardia brasiliensis]
MTCDNESVPAVGVTDGNGRVRHRLTTAQELESIIGHPAPMIMLKQVSALDEGCRAVLAHCPIAAFGYRDADGVSHTTFVGGAPGFARVRSATRISFALSEPGDPRGPVSLFFLLPGVGELLRVNGIAAGRKGAQTIVDVEQAFVHCAQAILRSRLWRTPIPAEPAAEVTGAGALARPGVAEFLAAAPFLALSTWDTVGGSDTSPRGDRQTVARILDDRTLIIPDRRGNKRTDSLHNLIQDERLSFAALVPGRTDVLHVRGRGAITDDSALLDMLALRGTAPHAALLIEVEDAEVLGSDAVTRSRLWDSATFIERGSVPDLMGVGGRHLAANSTTAAGGPPGFLLKILGAVPGIDRLVRFVIDRAYRSGLRKEGYEDIEQGSAEHRPAPSRVRGKSDSD